MVAVKWQLRKKGVVASINIRLGHRLPIQERQWLNRIHHDSLNLGLMHR